LPTHVLSARRTKEGPRARRNAVCRRCPAKCRSAEPASYRARTVPYTQIVSQYRRHRVATLSKQHRQFLSPLTKKTMRIRRITFVSADTTMRGRGPRSQWSLVIRDSVERGRFLLRWQCQLWHRSLLHLFIFQKRLDTLGVRQTLCRGLYSNMTNAREVSLVSLVVARQDGQVYRIPSDLQPV
jgi:hypothetical protein